MHHIVPKYLGGTDDPDNLVRLTVEEHADAHRVLWERHGDWRDFLAWKGLCGEIDRQEIIHRLRVMGSRKGNASPNNPIRNGTINLDHCTPQFMAALSEMAQTPQARAKKKASFAKIKHQQGHRNSQYGTRWIHSLSERKSKRINRGDPLPDRWAEGRKMRFD